jgi:hypothetical protein
MRFAIAVAILAWAALFSGPAAADLYRWVDPATGSVKFSNYPPPWYGDPEKERRAPKVEVIPDRSSAPSSGPKPEDEARKEAKPAAKTAARPDARPEARPGDKSPDRPVDKPDGAAPKERPGDGR